MLCWERMIHSFTWHLSIYLEHFNFTNFDCRHVYWKSAIKAEREAKKAAKANKKAGNKVETKSDDKESPQPAAASQPDSAEGKTKEQLKAERKAAFELAQKQKAEAGEAAAGVKEGEKSKAELKAERRAKQEAQRAAKEAAKEAGQKKVPEGKQSKEPKVKVPDEIKADDKKVEKKLNKTLKDQNIASRTKVQRQVGLFSHLHQYERELSVTRNLPIVGSNIHPCIIQLGLQHAEGEIVGSSARCISLLSAIKSLLLDSLQQLASSSDINKELDNLLKPNIIFLRQVGSTWSRILQNLYLNFNFILSVANYQFPWAMQLDI